MIVCFEGIDGSGKSTQANRLAMKLNSNCLDANKQRVAKYFSITDFAKDIILGNKPEIALTTNDIIYRNTFDKEKVNSLTNNDNISKICYKIGETLNILENYKDSTYLFDRLATGYLDLARCLFKLFSIYSHENNVLILDRWLWSTIAYNAANKNTVFNSILSVEDIGLNPGMVDLLISLTHKVIIPDLVIYLDVDPSIASSRRKERGAEDSVLENNEYQMNVSKAYNVLLNKRNLEYRQGNTIMHSAYPNVVEKIDVNNKTEDEVFKEVLRVFKEHRI